TSIVESPFANLHVDLWGPYKVPCIGGNQYFLTIVDNHSRVTWTFLLKSKDMFGVSVKVVRSDNGTEIVQGQCQRWIAQIGVINQRSVLGNPQQNARVEMKQRYLVETTRALRLVAHLPIKFWGDCILAAKYIINRMPSSMLAWKTPFEQPTYDSLKVIGCLCYSLFYPRDKFASKARRCYPNAQKAYKLYDLDFHQTFSRCHIQRNSVSFSSLIRGHFYFSPPYPATSSSLLPLVEPIEDKLPLVSLVQPLLSFVDNAAPTIAESSSVLDEAIVLPLIPRQSSRQRIPPSTLRNFVCPTIFVAPSNSLATSFLASQYNLTTYSDEYRASLCNVLSLYELVSYAQAAKDPQWVAAMEAELEALDRIHTWNLVDLPHDKVAIGCKWVYKIKFRTNGSVERYKARLVAKGYNQIEGKDYKFTFSLVAKFASVRIFLPLVAAKYWPIQQLDINNAFFSWIFG
ncbi:LOW QUALITY PROTEIN: hypothetical protein V2J09_018668, partial [Rumex salicifolius]